MINNVDITFHPSWWNKHAGIEFDEKFFFDPEYREKADIKMRKTLYDLFGEYGIGEKDPKARPILFSDLIASGFLYSQIMGCDIVFKKNDAPQVLPKEITAEEIEALSKIDLDSHPVWQKVQSQIDYYMDKFGYTESAINLMGIQNIALDLRGEELFIDYFDEPELKDKLLSVVTDLSIDIGKRLYKVSKTVSGGVTSIVKQVIPDVYLTSNCSVTMLSNDQYCEHLLKYDQMLAKEFPVFGIHHCGSNTEQVINGYLEVENLRFLEIGAGSDLKRVADAIGDRDIISCIRYSPVALKSEDKYAIYGKMKNAIEAFGSDERLCFSCVGIDANTNHDEVRSYLEAFSLLKNDITDNLSKGI